MQSTSQEAAGPFYKIGPQYNNVMIWSRPNAHTYMYVSLNKPKAAMQVQKRSTNMQWLKT